MQWHACYKHTHTHTRTHMTPVSNHRIGPKILKKEKEVFVWHVEQRQTNFSRGKPKT